MIKKEIFKGVLMISLIVITLAVTVQAQRIIYVTTDEEIYKPGETADIEFMILADELVSDYKYKITIRKTPSDYLGSVPGERTLEEITGPLDIKKGENKTIKESWDIPENAESGWYKAVLYPISPDGRHSGVASHLFNVSDEGQKEKAIKIENIIFEQDGEYGQGLAGWNVEPDSPFLYHIC